MRRQLYHAGSQRPHGVLGGGEGCTFRVGRRASGEENRESVEKEIAQSGRKRKDLGKRDRGR